MRALLGIDEGTSSVKAQLFDLDFRALATARREKATAHPADGRCEQDASEVLRAVVEVVGELLEQAPDAEIVGCGLDHQGESVVAFDPDTLRPLSPIVTWQDKRSQALLDGLPADARTVVRERSSLPLDPYFSAGKIAWLLDEGLPDTAVIGTVDAFLCASLGNAFATDRSTASRTQLARIGEPGWDPELCEIFGVDSRRLPTLRDSVGQLGTLRHPSWRTELPLCAQVVDQQAALAGSGCVVPGRAKATFGTGVFVLAFVGPEPPLAATAAGIVPTVAWTAAGVTSFALEGGVFSAGSLVDWLTGELGLFASAQQLMELAASVPDARGVRVLPALAGLGAPWWNAAARGVISGLTAGSGRAHIARAALDGICHSVCDVLDEIRRFTELDGLRIDGGLTRSQPIAQLQSDLAQLAVETGSVDATCLGAAALAAVGAGILGSVQEIADAVPAQQRFEPRPSPASRTAWREFVATAATL